MDWVDPSWMSSVAGSSYRDLFCYGAGIAGNVFAFVLFISPLPTFKRIVRNGSTEQFSVMPYVYSLLNCLICMWYGLPFVSYGVVLVATVNSIGAAFQLAYTAVFIAFAADAKQRLKVSGVLTGVFVVFGLIMYVSLEWFDHKTRQTFIGYISVASLIFMFASPLSIINLVITTKSVEYMPFYLSLSMFLMNSEWDWNCIGRNTVVAVCLLQQKIERGSKAAVASHTYMSVPKISGSVSGLVQVLRACTVAC